MGYTGDLSELAGLREELQTLAGALNAYQLRVVLSFVRALFLE